MFSQNLNDYAEWGPLRDFSRLPCGPPPGRRFAAKLQIRVPNRANTGNSLVITWPFLRHELSGLTIHDGVLAEIFYLAVVVQL